MKHRLSGPVLISAAGAIVLVLVLVVTDPTALQTMLALPLVLFLPGFALTIILFDWERLGIPERILLSVGLSVSLTALIGLLLNFAPGGLRTTTLWTALLFVLVVEVAVIVLFRRLQLRDVSSLPASLNFTERQWVFVSLAALVTITAIFVARTPAPPHGLEGYTTLWIQPTGTPDTLHLGVRSEEFETTKYQIRFEFNGAVSEGPVLELKPGETWESMLHLTSDPLGGPLTVFLYRLDNPTEVYRHVVWRPATE